MPISSTSFAILAIDQGTTSTRVLGVRADGSLSIVHAVRHDQNNPADGWVEQDGEEILANIEACLAVALQSGPDVKAIGLSNQGESCLAWDAVSKKPLSPIITWQDNRTRDITAALQADGHADRVKALTGLPLDAYFSASKLGWLMENNVAVREAHHDGRLRLGTTDAFYLDCLTGHFATDVSTASRTSLMDISTGAWSAELCQLFGVPLQCLPEIRSTMDDFGRWRDIPVTSAIVDQQAALYGHGCRKPGDIKITFGTGAFCLIMADGLEQALHAKGGLLPTIAWAQDGVMQYALDGGVYDAGSAIEWAIHAGFAASPEDFAAFDAPPAIDRGLVFVPAFSGLACPHWDRTASPVMIGMGPTTGMVDMRQALMEGVALLTVDIVELAARDMELSTRISVDGGMTRSAYFCQFLADSLGREIVVPAFDELTALGIAALAAEGAGLPFNPVFSQPEQRFQPMPVDRALRSRRFASAISRSSGWRDIA